MKEIKAVLFDLDDTLIESAVFALPHHQKIAKMMGLRVPSKEEMGEIWGISWRSFIEKLWPGVDVEEYKRTFIKNDCPSYPLFDGAREILKLLREKNIYVGVVSNRKKDLLQRELKANKIDEKELDFIEAAEGSGNSKPSPLIFSGPLNFFGKKGVKNSEILYVGDALSDLEAATKAGINFIAVTTGTAKREKFREHGLNDEHILNSILELKNFFN